MDVSIYIKWPRSVSAAGRQLITETESFKVDAVDIDKERKGIGKCICWSLHSYTNTVNFIKLHIRFNKDFKIVGCNYNIK
jgi:hypothetical protein